MNAESPLVARMQRMAGIGGWEVDLLTRALTWTSETYRIHEVTPACFVPTLESATDFYVTEHLPLLRRALEGALESAAPFDLELEMITGRGRRLWVRAIGQVQVRAGRPRRLFGLIQDITERRRLEREVMDIARYDRERAVRALHDDLGQALTGMSLMLRCLSQRLPTEAPVLMNDFETLITLMNRSIGTCRSLAKGLAPASASHGGLLTAARELADAYAQSRGISVRVRQRGSVDLTAMQAEQIFNIAQAAIIAMGDHGAATRILACIAVRGAMLLLTVGGERASVDALESNGAAELSVLRRRANLCGATLEVMRRTRGRVLIRCTLRVQHSPPARLAEAALLC